MKSFNYTYSFMPILRFFVFLIFVPEENFFALLILSFDLADDFKTMQRN